MITTANIVTSGTTISASLGMIKLGTIVKNILESNEDLHQAKINEKYMECKLKIFKNSLIQA